MEFEFSKFVRSVLRPLHFTRSEVRFLQRLRFSSGTYNEFSHLLLEYPKSEQQLLKAANELFKDKIKEPVTSSVVALGMIGFIPARNYLAASLLKRIEGPLLPSHPNVTQALKFALATEREAGESAVASDYFLAGFVYDMILDALGEHIPNGGAEEVVEEVWRHGIEVMKIARVLSKTVFAKFGLDRDLVVDCILHDIGKIAYSVVCPESEANIVDGPALAEVRWQNELKEYSFPHDSLGYMLLSKIGFLPDTSWVVLYHHQPYLAQRSKGGLFARATLTWLADHFLRYNSYHRPKGLNKRMVNNWFEVTKLAVADCQMKDFETALMSVAPR